MNINTKIAHRRKELGLTLEDVGKIVGVGKSTVRKWETGDIENMKRDKIALLAQALKVSPLFIMGLEEDDAPSSSKRGISLSNDELSLITNYRMLPAVAQQTVRDLISSLQEISQGQDGQAAQKEVG